MNLYWALSVACLLAAAVRLLNSHLTQQFRFFFIYLCLSVASAGALVLAGKPNSVRYMIAWSAFDPILQVALLLAVAELVDLIYNEYPRLGKFGGWLLAISTLIALALCFGTASPEITKLDQLRWIRPLTKFVFLAHRWTATIAFGSLLLVTGFLARYRRPIAPIVVRHAAIMFLYLASQAVAFLVINLWPKSRDVVNSAQLLTSAACGIAWTFALGSTAHVLRERETSLEELDEARASHVALLDEMRRIRPSK